MVHGDDYLSSGQSEDLDWLKAGLEKEFEIQTQRVGKGEGKETEGKILNRIVRWTEEGYELEADPRHIELVVKQLGIEGEKPFATPGVEDTDKEEEVEEDPLTPEEATRYRGIAARINYLSPDRPDVLYATKEACRDMSCPSRRAWQRLVRIGRFLLGRPRLIWHFRMQEAVEFFDTYSDANWAACKTARKSTSGGQSTSGRIS